MTHSHERHDAFICATWLVNTGRRDSITCATYSFICATYSFICATYPFICAAWTNLCVRITSHVTCARVTPHPSSCCRRRWAHTRTPCHTYTWINHVIWTSHVTPEQLLSQMLSTHENAMSYILINEACQVIKSCHTWAAAVTNVQHTWKHHVIHPHGWIMSVDRVMSRGRVMSHLSSCCRRHSSPPPGPLSTFNGVLSQSSSSSPPPPPPPLPPFPPSPPSRFPSMSSHRAVLKRLTWSQILEFHVLVEQHIKISERCGFKKSQWKITFNGSFVGVTSIEKPLALVAHHLSPPSSTMTDVYHFAVVTSV